LAYDLCEKIVFQDLILHKPLKIWLLHYEDMAHFNQSTLHIFRGYYADTKFPVANGKLHMVLAQPSINDFYYDLDSKYYIVTKP
jgi:hypothetical protein